MSSENPERTEAQPAEDAAAQWPPPGNQADLVNRPFLDPIEALVSVSKVLFDLQVQLAQMPPDRRGRVGNDLEAVSRCLTGMSRKLRAGEEPRAECAELKGYADSLPVALTDVLGENGALELTIRLQSTYQVDRLLAELEQAERGVGRETELARLDEAAQIFHDVATALRTAG